MDEAANVGIAILYTPGQGERHASQHTVTSEIHERGYNDTESEQGRTIIWDRLLARLPSTTAMHTMALKLISSDTGQQTNAGKATSRP